MTNYHNYKWQQWAVCNFNSIYLCDAWLVFFNSDLVRPDTGDNNGSMVNKTLPTTQSHVNASTDKISKFLFTYHALRDSIMV